MFGLWTRTPGRTLDARFTNFYGSPTGERVWNELGKYLRRAWKHPSGNDLRIIRTFIDSGYEPDRVYKFAQVMGGYGIWIAKGVGGSDRPIVGRPSKNNAARVNVFPLGVNTIKQILFTRLRNSEAGPGYFHIGDFADDEFIRQLTSEKLVTRYSRGIPRTEFKKYAVEMKHWICWFTISPPFIRLMRIPENPSKIKRG